MPMKDRIEDPSLDAPDRSWLDSPLLPEWEGDELQDLSHDAGLSDRLAPALRSLYNSTFGGTTPRQLGEDAVLDAIFPFLGKASRGVRALKGVSSKHKDMVGEAMKRLGSKEQELLEQANVVLDNDDTRFLGKFDVAYEHPENYKYAHVMEELSKPDPNLAPGTVKINPTNIALQSGNAEELIDNIVLTARHELEHANQFYNNLDDFRAGRSALLPMDMYASSGRFGNFPKGTTDLASNERDKYLMNPFEIGARAAETGGHADYTHAFDPVRSFGGDLTTYISDGLSHYGSVPPPHLQGALNDVVALTRDKNRIIPDLDPEYMQWLLKNSTGEFNSLVRGAKTEQSVAVLEALERLSNKFSDDSARLNRARTWADAHGYQ